MNKKYRFEKSNYGYLAHKKEGNAYIFFGHFRTKKEAVLAAIEAEQLMLSEGDSWSNSAHFPSIQGSI